MSKTKHITSNLRQLSYELSVRQLGAKRLSLASFIIILSIFIGGCSEVIAPIASDHFGVFVELEKCIDGDTARFMINDIDEKVRFLSIDSPELNNGSPEPFALDASNYTCDKLKQAHTIYLEFDPSSNERDQYNRLLAWIWVDDVLLNSDLIENGLAVTKYMYDDYLYNDVLLEAEAIAKENKMGVWSND